jgi:3-phosphoshikimate 1-carboxyvinyltransferase
MNITIHPGLSLVGEVSLPGDKSLSHRAALFAALAEGESWIENFQDSGVTRTMLSAITELGVEWSLEGTRLHVQGPGWRELRPPQKPMNCGNSATTFRLLSGALSASGLPAVLDGSPGLRRRPMNRILHPLREMGVPVDAADGSYAPLRFAARPAAQPLRGIEYPLPVASAQVKSCLLLAGLAADRPLTLHEPGPSRDHTERMLKNMGCRLEAGVRPRTAYNSVVLHPPLRPLSPLQMRLPGDISSASFLIAAALIVPGSEVTVRNVGLNPTRTGFLDILQQMGADLTVQVLGEEAGEPYGDVTVRSSYLSGAVAAGNLVVRMIDEFPILAITACYAEGTTQVKDAAELRHKESDRIGVLCGELKRLGAQVTETEDGFSIHGPCPLNTGEVDPHSDHRLAMSFAVAGLAGRGSIRIRQAEIMHESFPEFMQTLGTLGAAFQVEADNAG